MTIISYAILAVLVPTALVMVAILIYWIAEPYIESLRYQRPKMPNTKNQWAWRPPKYAEHTPPKTAPPEDDLIAPCQKCNRPDVFESRHGQWFLIWPQRYCKVPVRPGGWIKLDDSK